MEKAVHSAGALILLFLCLGTREVTSQCVNTGKLSPEALEPGRLMGAAILTVQVPSVLQCLAICAGRSICLSINYNSQALLCEINHETSGGNTSLSTNFTQVAAQTSDVEGSWVHVKNDAVKGLDLAGECSTKPCQDDEACIPLGKNGRQCVSSGVTCKEPPVVEDASVQWNGTRIRDEAVYDCSFGFQLLGESLSKCLPNGKWLPAPRCVRIDCGVPPDLANASVTFNGTKYLDRASYQCSAGFRDIGTMNQMSCLENSTWSATDVRCVRDCGSPPAFQDAIADYNTTTYNSSVKYTCPSGFLLTANSNTTLHCNANGVWGSSTNRVFCSPVSCYKANPLSPNGYLYQGTVNTDVLGRVCQRWDSSTPHAHTYVDATRYVHDGGIANAQNYCRILDENRPWCFSTIFHAAGTVNTSWAFCPVPAC